MWMNIKKSILTLLLSALSFLALSLPVQAFEENTCLDDVKTVFAKRFCEKALDKSNIYQSLLGYLYLSSPDEIATSDAKGFYWLRAASRNCINFGFGEISESQKQILIQTMFDTAEFYRLGKGVGKNHKNALFWYLKASNHAYLPAYKRLAHIYEKGVGTAKSLTESAKWLTQAARKGDAQAQLKLASWYTKGRGVKVSPLLAKKWYQAACQQGVKQACHE